MVTDSLRCCDAMMMLLSLFCREKLLEEQYTVIHYCYRGFRWYCALTICGNSVLWIFLFASQRKRMLLILSDHDGFFSNHHY
jgi:hypothetical protein